MTHKCVRQNFSNLCFAYDTARILSKKIGDWEMYRRKWVRSELGSLTWNATGLFVLFSVILISALAKFAHRHKWNQ